MGKASSQTTNYYSPKPAAPPQSCKTNEIVYNTRTKHMLASRHVCTLHAHTQFYTVCHVQYKVCSRASFFEMKTLYTHVIYRACVCTLLLHPSYSVLYLYIIFHLIIIQQGASIIYYYYDFKKCKVKA